MKKFLFLMLGIVGIFIFTDGIFLISTSKGNIIPYIMMIVGGVALLFISIFLFIKTVKDKDNDYSYPCSYENEHKEEHYYLENGNEVFYSGDGVYRDDFGHIYKETEDGKLQEVYHQNDDIKREHVYLDDASHTILYKSPGSSGVWESEYGDIYKQNSRGDFVKVIDPYDEVE